MTIRSYFSSQFQDRVHVGHLAVEVDRDDRRHSAFCFPVDQSSRSLNHGRTAPSRYSRRFSGSRLYVASSMSTNTVRAPACEIASVVAMNVFGTVTTASPAPTPAAIRANRSASVPLPTPTQWAGLAELREILLEALHHRDRR